MLRGKVITDGDVARVLLNNITHVCGLMHADVGNRPNVALRVAGESLFSLVTARRPLLLLLFIVFGHCLFGPGCQLSQNKKG